MRFWVPVLLYLAISPAAAADWIQVPQKRACGPLPAGYVCSASTQVSFGYPVGWSAVPYNNGLVYAPSLIRFGADGVAGGWYLGGAWTLGAAPGQSATIGGMPAKIDVDRQGCRAYLDGDELISAAVVTRRRHVRYLFLACIKGPDLGAREAEITNVLASARFPYG